MARSRPGGPRWTGAQLSVVTEKLNVVTDRGRRKLSVVTDGALEKGQRYHTFIHTERALDLSDHTNQNIQSICYAYTRRHTYIQTHKDIYIYTHTYIYIYAYLYVPRYTYNK